MSISKTIKVVLLLQIYMLCLQGDLYSQIVINEVMASNATSNASNANNYDWIELYNTTSSTIDLSGYSLTDDPENPSMWQFPSGTVMVSHGYLIVYADGSGVQLHTNFKLSKEGEQLILVNKNGVVLDSFTFPYQLTNISYGRKRNEPQVLGYFVVPTLGKINDFIMANGISPTPVCSVKGGFHSGAQTVGISVASQDAKIYYTLDGTEPTTGSTPYAESIVLTKTSVLRVKSFIIGFLPSLTITQSYFIDEPMNLPVISLVTDPDHFFSDETGIYVQGTAGVAGYCTSVPHNLNQDWERPVNIELFEKDGTVGLNQMAGVKIFGGCSRIRYPIKSLAFFARKEYETSSFDYQLFPDKSSKEYDTFILRASGDDQPFTIFKDELTQTVVKDVIDIDVQAYRPVVLYINGEYWGIHNMREKINEHYANDNFGANADSVDVLKRNPQNSWEIIHGSAKHYNAMMAYLQNNDITQPVHYNYICTQMDKDEYINYQITQIFFGGRDWPGNNIKFWRSREKPNDRWRWILYDLDHTFTEYFSDIMDEATEVDCKCDWPNPSWSTLLFRRLLENKSFRDEFIQRFFLYSESHFSRERIHGIIDQLQAAIAPEIPRHIQRWGGQKTNTPDNTWVSPIFSTVEEWEWNVNLMRDFTDTRHEMAKKHVMDYFGISGLSGFQASVKPAHQGSIVIGNAVITDTAVSADVYSGEPMEVSCKPEPGYVLSHWEVTRRQEMDSTIIKRGDSWKYLESRDTPPGNWLSLTYDEENWKQGKGQFGYGDGDEATVMGYGGDSQNKMITAWFRKKFTISDKTAFTRYTFHLLRDDGVRVFLNGREVIRDNMDRWGLGSYSTALVDVNGTNETRYQTYPINPALFLEGENILAVEIHQASATSSDLSFEMDLLATHLLKEATTFTSQENKLSLNMTNQAAVTAYMIPDTNRVENVLINEVMAKNSSGYTDELGQFEDWIELYNGGSAPVDLAGLYLTDALPPRDPWQIPKGFPELTTILPNGYKVFVADDEASQGILHASFKLDKAGDQVALLQVVGKDTLVIDHFQFGAQEENVSWGRYPDGSATLKFMPMSTPQAANFWQSTVSVATLPLLSEKVIVYPNPTHGPLFVKFNQQIRSGDATVQIKLYSNTGRLVSVTQHSANELIELSLFNQPQGLYLVRIIAGTEVYDRKIVVY